MLKQIISSRLINLKQELLINQFCDRFNYDSPGANLHIANYEQLFYQGIIAGSEFLTYAATKLYLCFDFEVSYSTVASANHSVIYFYDEANVLSLYGQNNSICYEAVAAAIWYGKNNVNIKNFYFSRLNVAQFNYMKFIGYRITLD